MYNLEWKVSDKDLVTEECNFDTNGRMVVYPLSGDNTYRVCGDYPDFGIHFDIMLFAVGIEAAKLQCQSIMHITLTEKQQSLQRALSNYFDWPEIVNYT